MLMASFLQMLESVNVSHGASRKQNYKTYQSNGTSPRNFNSFEKTSNVSTYQNISTDLFEKSEDLQDAEIAEFEYVLLFLILVSFSVITVAGNLLVITAVIREKALHTPTNYFITSLAVADGLIGLLVMPFGAIEEGMAKQWIFGADICDIWHSLDVLGTTASILNLCVISMDRYWAITDPMTYPAKMTDKRAVILILIVWVCSSAISFPAIAWWRATAPSTNETIHTSSLTCAFTEDMSYLIFSSTVSFYGPLMVMVFTYLKVYKAALEHTKSLRLGAKTLRSAMGGSNGVVLRIHRGGGGGKTSSYATDSTTNAQNLRGEASSIKCAANGKVETPKLSPSRHKSDSNSSSLSNYQRKGGSVFNQEGDLPPNVGISRKISKFAKEKKAAKTLGTVMGIFIICWLPFFITNVISGVCGQLKVECIYNPNIVFPTLTWLGWLNSCMNPFIYACCSNDFRRAFTRVLCCRSVRANHGNVTINKRLNMSTSNDTTNKKFFKRLKFFGTQSVKTCPRNNSTVSPEKENSKIIERNYNTNLQSTKPVERTCKTQDHNNYLTVQIRHEQCSQNQSIPPILPLHKESNSTATSHVKNIGQPKRANIGTQIKQSRAYKNDQSKQEIYNNKNFIHKEVLITPICAPSSAYSPQNSTSITQNHMDPYKKLTINQYNSSWNNFSNIDSQEKSMADSYGERTMTKNDGVEKRKRMVINHARLEECQISSKFHRPDDNSYPLKVDAHFFENQTKSKNNGVNDNKERMIDNVIEDEEDNTSSYNCKLFICPSNEGWASSGVQNSSQLSRVCGKDNVMNSVKRTLINQQENVADKATSTKIMISKSTSCLAKLSAKEQDKKQKVQNISKSKSTTLRKHSLKCLSKRKCNKNNKSSTSINSTNSVPSNCINLYNIPPPNYLHDPNRSIEKLL